MDKGYSPSKALNIPGKDLDLRPTTTSKSPGDWHSPLNTKLNARSIQELHEARMKIYQESRWDGLQIEIVHFVGYEATAMIQKIIKTDFNSTISRGDSRIDTVLRETLKKIKCEHKMGPPSGDIPFQPDRETQTTYKVRKNPQIAHEMDKEIIKMALLINGSIRLTQAK